MKYKKMKEKLLPVNLQLFAEEEGSDGDDSGDDGDDQDDGTDEGGEDDSSEKKYTEKDMEDAVKRRLSRERRKWQRKQESTKQDGNADDAETEDVKARKEAESKASKMEVKIACFEADVAKESVDDVAALAHAYMAADEDLDLEDAIEKVVKKYPQFKKGVADPYEEETKGKSWGQRQNGAGAKKTDGVMAEFLKKNPGLKI